MAIKTAVIPWLSGGALVLGYVGYAWRRGKRVRTRSHRAEPQPAAPAQNFQPLSDRLESIPAQLVLELEELEEFEALPALAMSKARERRVDLGARFFSRASVALSPVGFGPAEAGVVPRHKAR